MAYAISIAAVITWFKVGNWAPEWVNIVLCAWIWLIGPVVLIVTAGQAKSEIDWENPRGLPGILLRLIIGSQLAFWGLTFILFGVGIVALYLWNVLVERKYDWLESVRGLPIMLTMIGLGSLMLFGAFRRGRITREEYEKQEAAFAIAVRNPDWDFYERHLCRPVPEAIISLFQSDPEESVSVEQLSPIDESYLLKREDTGLDFDILPLAFSEEDEPIFLKPGATESDEIYIATGSGYQILSNSTASWVFEG